MGDRADGRPSARRRFGLLALGLAAAALAALAGIALRRGPTRPAAEPPRPPHAEALRLVGAWEAGARLAPDDLRAFARAVRSSPSRAEAARLCERVAGVLEARLPGEDAATWGEPVREVFSAWRTFLPGDPFPALDPASPGVQERYLALRSRLRAAGATATSEALALASGGRDLGDEWWRRRNGAAALAAYDEALRRLESAAPLDADAREVLAAIESGRGIVLLNLFRWTEAEQALAAAVVARESASPSGDRARALAVDRARWGWALLYAGRTGPAIAQLERALADLGEAADAFESREPGPQSLRARLRVARIVAGSERSDSPADRLEVGRVFLARRDGAAALPHFEVALLDPRFRGDVREAALYDAACAASIAAETAPAAERSVLLAKALAWLGEDLSIRRKTLADLEASGASEDDLAAARARLDAHYAWVRGDGDLAALHGTPEFEALFRR